MLQQFSIKTKFWLIVTFILYTAYSIFTYGLTTPNLILIGEEWFSNFQFQMWDIFFHDRKLSITVYLSLIILIWLCTWKLISILKAKISLKNSLIILAFLIAPLIFSYNALSADVFNYIFNAKMVVYYRANPHQNTAIDYSYDDWTRFMHNVHTPAPYGYGWTIFSILPYWLSQNKFFLAWLIFRLLSVVSLVLLVKITLELIKITKTKVKWSQLGWLLFNPLLLIEIISNSHNDLWMMIPALWSLLLILKNNNKFKWKNLLLSVLLLGFSISTKMATLAITPIWLGLLIAQLKPKLMEKSLGKLFLENWPTIASILMFLPLLTPRSKQFLPWYLTWALVFLPLSKNKIWKTLLISLSFSSLLRYLPWMLNNAYSPEIIVQQKYVTWLLPIPLLLFIRLGKKYKS